VTDRSGSSTADTDAWFGHDPDRRPILHHQTGATIDRKYTPKKPRWPEVVGITLVALVITIVLIAAVVTRLATVSPKAR
jgi:hypothetical protein